MLGHSNFIALVAGSVLLALAAAAPAQEELINLTFDGPPDPGYTYPYDYSGGGNPQTDHSNLSSATASVVGGGRGGGNAFTISGDFTNVPVMPDYNYKGIGGGLGVFRYNFETMTAQGVPSGNLADYRMTVDLAGTGFLAPPPEPVIEIQMQFLLPDDYFTPDPNTDFERFAHVNFRLPPTTDYSTVTFTLDQGTLVYSDNVPADQRDFARHAPNIGLLNPNFNFDANFGNDADNRLSVDNVRLTVIPEPATALLLPAAVGFGMTRRPRRPRG
jgi:hypothetical protein